MGEPLVVVGAGGFGREVIDVIDAINSVAPTWELLGVVDDGPSSLNLGRLERRGVQCLGTIERFLASWSAEATYVVGIGSPSVRQSVAARFDQAGYRAAVLVHPGVSMGFDVEIGAGSILCAGVGLTTNITLGRHVHLNPGTLIGHDTTLGDFVSVNPSVTVSGDCTIQDGVLLGAGAVVSNRLTVGVGSIVGAAACVVREVPAGAVVKGVPAR